MFNSILNNKSSAKIQIRYYVKFHSYKYFYCILYVYFLLLLL